MPRAPSTTLVTSIRISVYDLAAVAHLFEMQNDLPATRAALLQKALAMVAEVSRFNAESPSNEEALDYLREKNLLVLENERNVRAVANLQSNAAREEAIAAVKAKLAPPRQLRTGRALAKKELPTLPEEEDAE